MRYLRSSVLFVGGLTACADPAPPQTLAGDGIEVRYDEQAQRVDVVLRRAVGEGETLHARLRQGAVGQLDCDSEAAAISRIDEDLIAGAAKPTYAGPEVADDLFASPYDSRWLEAGEPSPEMLAAIAGGEYIIDVCLMGLDGVVQKAEIDLRRALDRAGSNGKFDDSGEARIASTTAYAEACVGEMGEIPFFPKLADGDYGTYNCLNSTPIPMTVTAADGTVTKPSTQVAVCDNPQYIYSLCEPNAESGKTNGPRVTSAANDQGTHWVLLCRKSLPTEGTYNDIAMIGHNPYTGRTCYFQNALYSRTDGLHVPHPGDKVESQASPQQSPSLWEGIHGGIGNGIECAECHDSDPFVHTPWIDGAVDAKGDPIVPKMGVDDDFGLGFNDAPYTIVNTAGQGWKMPKSLTSPEANACTRCHRIGDGRWMKSWINRLDGTEAGWAAITTEAHRVFNKTTWMPPEVDGLDGTSWPTSDFGKAVAFIKGCATNPSACTFAELPKTQIADEGGLPEIELEGDALAKGGLAVLGATLLDPTCTGGNCATRRCAECHSTSRSGLRRWLEDTERAWNTCNLAKDPDTMTSAEALTSVNCLRTNPAEAGSVFAAANLGVLATGVQYGFFRKLFRKAFGEGAWLIEYTKFKARVGMPKGNHPKLSQREFAVLHKWFKAGLPMLDEALPEAPAPETCVDELDQTGISAHLSEMRFEGWGAVNTDAGIRMFGCKDADPLACFTVGNYPDRTDLYGVSGSTVRELSKLTFRTSFWTRSSADGRFVGNGGGMAGSTITDLLNAKDIGVDASYDPGFFPDNSGFMFQGATGGAGICAQSVLETGDPVIDFKEAGCMTATGINLYQHVARGLSGGDYFVINSQFTSDAGHSTDDPAAHFGGSSTMKFTPMLFNGTTYQPMKEVITDSPYEGDSVLSPSSRLVGSRLAGAGGRSLGYVIRAVSTTRSGDTYRVDCSRKLGTVCAQGAKLNFSFDERFFVTHHYESDGRANLFLVDLATGKRTQITDVEMGTKALFPHFRSDGWLYFLVRAPDGEYVVTSDAALRVAAQDPR